MVAFSNMYSMASVEGHSGVEMLRLARLGEKFGRCRLRQGEARWIREFVVTFRREWEARSRKGGEVVRGKWCCKVEGYEWMWKLRAMRKVIER
jgi:hypothetical protein